MTLPDVVSTWIVTKATVVAGYSCVHIVHDTCSSSNNQYGHEYDTN